MFIFKRVAVLLLFGGGVQAGALVLRFGGGQRGDGMNMTLFDILSRAARTGCH